jgi:hypothetical protein
MPRWISCHGRGGAGGVAVVEPQLRAQDALAAETFVVRHDDP